MPGTRTSIPKIALGGGVEAVEILSDQAELFARLQLRRRLGRKPRGAFGE
jgi:hypothetical protein